MYLNKFSYQFWIICILIFIKNLILGPRISTDFEYRYLPLANSINKLIDGNIANLLSFEIFDILHIGYGFVVFILLQFSQSNLGILLVFFQTFLFIIALYYIYIYFENINKFYLFTILYLLLFELNQWDYWLTPDSIFRSAILIIYVRYIFKDKIINLFSMITLIAMLSLFRMEAIIYFLPLLYLYFNKLKLPSKILFIFIIFIFLIPISYGILLMMIDTYKLGLISGGAGDPQEYINYIRADRFGSAYTYFIYLYSMRFFSVITPLSPSWSYLHLLYNFMIYSLLYLLYKKYGTYIGEPIFKNWLFYIYLLTILVQVGFVVDPTLRYMYTVYTLILIYVIKNSIFLKNEKN